ncbi:hypothetical protein NC796_21915 [Aliifodinibius sp. S!AR15-10]|uniref:hypothetical protein n=1 Tax=Aliifodinibius sp. S!AR15-10 TaxID=2950437 RepID=UPI00285F1455|nr:hypothetical protein [Aliifodinibius sp. S!AR15-10]MDR8393825.1 hypothetical protein [Aliifodinibius sp. S!AR15-10]
MDLPDRWPALHTMLIDDENRLWIATIVDDREVYRWWVLSEEGKLLARFDWPRDHPIEDVKNGNLYSVETSEKTGERNVIRYRIHLTSR